MRIHAPFKLDEARRCCRLPRDSSLLEGMVARREALSKIMKSEHR